MSFEAKCLSLHLRYIRNNSHHDELIKTADPSPLLTLTLTLILLTQHQHPATPQLAVLGRGYSSLVAALGNINTS